MILVRDIFQLKFGKAKEAKALIKEFEVLRIKYSHAPTRFMTDLVGQYYTFVMEATHENLSVYESAMQNTMGAKEFGEWYQKFVPLIESGRREIFTIVD